MSRKTTRFTFLSLLASTLFSFHISPDLRKAVPLAPMSGNHISYEVEVIRAQESFASEMAGNIHPPLHSLILENLLPSSSLANAVYVHCTFLLLLFHYKWGEVAGTFFLSLFCHHEQLFASIFLLCHLFSSTI